MGHRLDERERRRREREMADRTARGAGAGSAVVGTALRNYNELGRTRPSYGQTLYTQIYFQVGGLNRGMFNCTMFNSTAGFSSRDPYTVIQTTMAGWGLGAWEDTLGFSEGAD